MNNGCRLWLHEQHCWFTAGYNLPDQGLLAKRAELFRIRQLRESLHIINLHILSGQALSNNQALSNIKYKIGETENMKTIIASMIAAAGLVMAGSVMAEDMPALAKKNGCTACHTIEKKLVGPAWRDVSKAYNKVGATGTAINPKAYQVSRKVSDILKEHGKATPEAWLEEKVAKGGKGDWFKHTAMIPNAPRVKAADIKELVDFILGLEKK